ncbi:MAG: DUF1552 domain-containing protein, partial [Planctomycetota bacterium]
MYQPRFFPKQTGKEYSITPLLKTMERHRSDFSVFSNLDHSIKGGHYAVHSFLSGVKYSQAASMPSGNITLDQRAAEVLGPQTRFPSLTVGSTDGLHGGCQMSWTRSGVRVPPISGPKELFRKLFLNDSPTQKASAVDNFHLHGSILDAALEDAHSLSRKLNQRDKTKLDEYFSSVRDIEQRIQQQEKWVLRDKPKAPIAEPTNDNLIEDLPELFDLIALALETDSTRIGTFEMAGANFRTGILGLNKGYHAYSRSRSSTGFGPGFTSPLSGGCGESFWPAQEPVGRGALDEACRLSLAAEELTAAGEDFAAVFLDCSKCYEHVPLTSLVTAAAEQGWPTPLLKGIWDMYRAPR